MITENAFSQYTIDLAGRHSFAYTASPGRNYTGKADAAKDGCTFYPCEVPGNFELDLQANGLIGDPFFGMNPETLRKEYEKCHVFYSLTFQASLPEGAEPWLVFEGLDCYADVYLNGRPIASFDNMLVEREACAAGLLQQGENELFVHIRPAVLEARKYPYTQSVYASPLLYESVYVRKAPHMYGWDIMPRFLSAGIFRPARMEWRPARRIAELYLKTRSIADGDAELDLYYRLQTDLDGEYALQVEMVCGGSAFARQFPVYFDAGHAVFHLQDARLWHTKGQGEPNLYEVSVALCSRGIVHDRRRFTHGVRTVELKRTALTTPEGDGEFVFLVNGKKVFCKGSNWVPVDAFHSRDRKRIPQILGLVNELNCNMLRCWGGNIYEDELFYDICDRSGILIWQDFTMACCIYPQDEDLKRRLGEEAELAVKRLRNHACVALWAGDNECDQAIFWNHSNFKPEDNQLTREVLPRVCKIHDGTRPYIASSPFYDSAVTAQNRRYTPEDHLWGPRNYFKSAYYMTAPCHFVSEIGYHGCPWPESVEKFISGECLWPARDNEQWLLHSSSPNRAARCFDYRVELMHKQILELFDGEPDTLKDFAFASQAVQAEAKKFFIERFRTGKWRRTGILWWNVMDGWPQFSDAIVDYYYNKKLAFGFIKSVQADVCVSVTEPEGWEHSVVICNDTPRDAALSVEITDIDTGEIVFSGDASGKADSSTVIGSIPYPRSRQRFLVIRWEGGAAGSNHYLSGEPPFSLDGYRRWLQKAGSGTTGQLTHH